MKLTLTVQEPKPSRAGGPYCGAADPAGTVQHGPYGRDRLIPVDDAGSPRCTRCSAARIRAGVDELSNVDDALALVQPDSRPYNDPKMEEIGARISMGGTSERALVDELLAAHDQRGVEEARQLLIGVETAVRLGGPGADRLRQALVELLEPARATA